MAATSRRSYCERRSAFSLSIDESRVERAQRGSEQGAGVRLISGETTYFSHVDGLAEADLDRAADAVAAALSAGRTEPQPLRAAEPPELQEIDVDPADVPAAQKADLLRACDETARAAGAEIDQVMASYSDGRRRVQVANSEGLHATDDRTRVRLGAQAVARRGDVVVTGFETLGGHRGFELSPAEPPSGSPPMRRERRSPCSTRSRPPRARSRSLSAAVSAASSSTR